MPRDRYSHPEPRKSRTKPPKWLGEWHTYIPDPARPGKDKRKHRGPYVLGLCSRMTKTEAQEELDRRIKADRKPKDQRPPGPETLGWAIDQHLHLSKLQWEEETLSTAKSVAKHLTAIRDIPLAAVTREQIQEHLNALAEAELSKSTVKKAKAILSSVFALAAHDGKIDRNPMAMVKMPKVRKRKNSRSLSDEEFMRLLAETHGRDHLIIRICGVLGLRPGELFALREDDLEPGRLRVDEASRNGAWKKPKTEASAAYVALPPSLEMELRHWMQTRPCDPAGLIFPSRRRGIPIRQNNYLKRVLKPLGERIGVDGVTFQALRRTTATHVQSLGTVKDAQTILRHASPDMTIGVYMQALPESVKAAVEALDEKLCGRLM
jgi:integrase